MFNRILFLLNDLSPVLGSETIADSAATAAGDAATTAGSTIAADPTGGLFGSMWIWVVWAVVIFGMYFLMMRPQRKREKQMKEMQASIKAGDNVVTSGGFFGRVADVGEDCFIVEFGTNRGVRVPVQKSDVLGIKSPKMTPEPKSTSD